MIQQRFRHYQNIFDAAIEKTSTLLHYCKFIAQMVPILFPLTLSVISKSVGDNGFEPSTSCL